MNQSQMDSFLADLTELSKKHGIYIGGCGCCGSPFLSGEANDETTCKPVDITGRYTIERDRERWIRLDWKGEI